MMDTRLINNAHTHIHIPQTPPGKNHNVPDWQSSQTGPFDLWPNNLGFEHFYGFIGGDTSQVRAMGRPSVWVGLGLH